MFEFQIIQQGTQMSSAIISTAVAVPGVFQLAFGDGTPKKALLTALVVGTILTTINHGDAILVGNPPFFLKVILTYCVPYCVTTWGVILGKRAQWLADHPSG